MTDLAALLDSVAGLHYDQEHYSEALKFYTRAYDLRRAWASSGGAPAPASASASAASAAPGESKGESKADAKEAMGEVKTGQPQSQQNQRPEVQRELATSLNNLGRVYRVMNVLTKAISYLQQALKIREQVSAWVGCCLS